MISLIRFVYFDLKIRKTFSKKIRKKMLLRTRDEVQEVRQTRDPITGFRDRIVGAGLAEITELKAIEVQVRLVLGALAHL